MAAFAGAQGRTITAPENFDLLIRQRTIRQPHGIGARHCQGWGRGKTPATITAIEGGAPCQQRGNQH